MQQLPLDPQKWQHPHLPCNADHCTHSHRQPTCPGDHSRRPGPHWAAPPSGPDVPAPGGLQEPVCLAALSRHERGRQCAPARCHAGGAGATCQPGELAGGFSPRDLPCTWWLRVSEALHAAGICCPVLCWSLPRWYSRRSLLAKCAESACLTPLCWAGWLLIRQVLHAGGSCCAALHTVTLVEQLQAVGQVSDMWKWRMKEICAVAI